jgi:hypothetical protein
MALENARLTFRLRRVLAPTLLDLTHEAFATALY